MLKLRSVTISNMGRFVGTHTLSLSGRNNFIQVDGFNSVSGGSSGAAKSTVFHAIDYVFGVNDLPTTVLQARSTKNAMEASVELVDEDSNVYVISRGKASGLTVSLNGQEISGGDVKSAEAELDRILKFPREHLRRSYHKKQKEGGFFLNLSPKKCHEFLADVLDQKQWSEKLKTAEEEASSLSKEKLSLETGLTNLLSMEKSMADSLAVLKLPTPTVSYEILTHIKSSAAEAMARLTAMELEKKNKELELMSNTSGNEIVETGYALPDLSVLKANLATAQAKESFHFQKLLEDLKKVSHDINQARLEIKDVENKKAALPALNQKIEALKLQIKTIKEGTCPTCQQTWTESHGSLDAKIAEARALFDNIKTLESLNTSVALAKIAELEPLEASVRAGLNISPYREEILGARAALEAAQEDARKQQELVSQARLALANKKSKELAALNEEYDKKLEALRYDLSEKTGLFIKKESEYNSYLAAMKEYDKNSVFLKEELAKFEKKVKECRDRLSSIDEEVLVRLEAAKTIRAYMNSSFQSALDSIAIRATGMLSKVPNMSTVTVSFEGFKETKSGAIREEVSALVSMDTDTNIPIASMSGGERTTIDLAVDLAVFQMIEERVGKGLDLFILDEPFDGVDEICQRQCLELLKANLSDKRIIIVDHSSETKEMVEDRILVVREGENSRFESN